MPLKPGKLFSRVEKMFTLRKEDRDYLKARKKRDKAAKDGHYGESSKEIDKDQEAVDTPARVMVPGKEYETERVEKIKVDKRGTVKEVKATEGHDRGTLPVPPNVMIGRVPAAGSNFTTAYTEAEKSDEDPKKMDGDEVDIDTRLVTGEDSDEEGYKKTVTTKKKSKVMDLDKLDDSGEEKFKSISDYEKKKEKDINKKAKDELAASKATKLKSNYVKKPSAMKSPDGSDETVITEEKKKIRGSQTISPEAQAKAAAMKAELEKDVTRPARSKKKVSENPGMPNPEEPLPVPDPPKSYKKIPEKKISKSSVGSSGSPPRKTMKPVAPAMGLGLEKPGQVSSVGDEKLLDTQHELPDEKHIKTEKVMEANKKLLSSKPPSIHTKTTEEDFEIRTSEDDDNDDPHVPPPVPPRVPSNNETDEDKKTEERHVAFEEKPTHTTRKVTETKAHTHGGEEDESGRHPKRGINTSEDVDHEDAVSNHILAEEAVEDHTEAARPINVKPSRDDNQEIHGVNYTQILCTKPGTKMTREDRTPGGDNKPSGRPHPTAAQDPDGNHRHPVGSQPSTKNAADNYGLERSQPQNNRSRNVRLLQRPQEEQEVVFE